MTPPSASSPPSTEPGSMPPGRMMLEGPTEATGPTKVKRRMPWSEDARKRTVLVLLVASLAALTWVVWPFAFALVLAVVTAVIAHPLYARILPWTGRHRYVAASATMGSLVLFVAVPFGIFVVTTLGKLRSLAVDLAERFPEYETPSAVVESVTGTLSPNAAQALDRELLTTDALLQAFPSVATMVSSTASTVVGFALDASVWLLASGLILAEGPRILSAVLRILPLEERHTLRLVYVFRSISRDLVYGNLATGAIQGFVAGLGFFLAGVPYSGLLGIAVFFGSFVPALGVPAVWIPVVIAQLFLAGWPTALFLALWNMILTGSVDNIARAWLMQGGHEVHPFLLFLCLLGGVTWMGLPGLVVGPLIAALALTAYTIYCEALLGEPRTKLSPELAEVREALVKQRVFFWRRRRSKSRSSSKEDEAA